MLCMSPKLHSAYAACFCCSVANSEMGSPSLKVVPFKSNSIWLAPLIVRQDFCASSMSLKAKPPCVRLVVASLDNLGGGNERMTWEDITKQFKVKR